MPIGAQSLIQASYFVAAALFIFGLKRMSSPVTARGGIVWAGVGMLVATLITFLWPEMHNYVLMTVAIAIGGIVAWIAGKRVAMTDMPQMIALYNGMGGGAAAAIAAVELYRGEAQGYAIARDLVPREVADRAVSSLIDVAERLIGIRFLCVDDAWNLFAAPTASSARCCTISGEAVLRLSTELP